MAKMLGVLMWARICACPDCGFPRSHGQLRRRMVKRREDRYWRKHDA